MEITAREILYQGESDLRHYVGRDAHYLFDNIDMRLYEVVDFPTQYVNSKLVHRNLFNLPEQESLKRANFNGYIAVVELTNDCNLKCVYCYRQQNLNNDFMSMDVADALINHFIKLDKDNILKDKNVNINFFGGEPLMNMPILKYIVKRLIDSIKNYSIYFSIVTNGMLLSKENMEYIIKNNIRTRISFEGDEFLQEKLRPTVNGKSAYKIIKQNLDNIPLEKRDLFSIAFSVSRFAGNLDSIIKTYIDLGFKKFNLLFIIDDIVGETNIKLENLNDIKETIDDVITMYADLLISDANIEIYPISDMMSRLHNRIPQINCHSSIDTETYGYDGSIYPCLRFLSYKEYIYGNIRTGYDQKSIDKLPISAIPAQPFR